MVASSLGIVSWSLNRDDEGHRTYLSTSRVLTTDTSDGPGTVMGASGLPAVGAAWAYGNDSDAWALCYPTMHVRPMYKDEKGKHWLVDQKFSTKPLRRCQTATIENPLNEPDKIGGTFVRYSKPCEVDRNGAKIANSSHEIITDVEKDDTRATVNIEQNVSTLDLEDFTEAMNKLNDALLWGLAARKVKLGGITWSRQLYGVCTYYYTRRFEFEIRFDGFDEADIIDAGKMVYNEDKYGYVGTGHANRDDPTKFKVVKDDNDENKPKKVLLDGFGSQLTTGSSPVLLGPFEIYEEYNMTLLGIPASL